MSFNSAYAVVILEGLDQLVEVRAAMHADALPKAIRILSKKVGKPELEVATLIDEEVVKVVFATNEDIDEQKLNFGISQKWRKETYLGDVLYDLREAPVPDDVEYYA